MQAVVPFLAAISGMAITWASMKFSAKQELQAEIYRAKVAAYKAIHKEMSHTALEFVSKGTTNRAGYFHRCSEHILIASEEVINCQTGFMDTLEGKDANKLKEAAGNLMTAMRQDLHLPEISSGILKVIGE